MNAFLPELDAVHSAIGQVPTGAAGKYSLPWYLVVGEPGSGRSTAIKAMDLSWVGTEPLRQSACNYWIAQEAVFAEPTAAMIGPRRDPRGFQAFCEALRKKRPREPLDGILLVVDVAMVADASEDAVVTYANALRAYLVEVGRHLHADIPVYIVATRYDTIWGFAEVFKWTAERAKEESWGFLLPFGTPSQQAKTRIREGVAGLGARFEATCLARLSSEDPPDERIRAFQHLAEVRLLIEKLRDALDIIAMTNAYERAPWVRGMIVGSAVPGTGDRLRAGMARFSTMGLVAGHGQPNRRPGGLPIHTFMKAIVLPERELVPLRVRWRDDWVILLGFVLGWLLIAAAVAWYVADSQGLLGGREGGVGDRVCDDRDLHGPDDLSGAHARGGHGGGPGGDAEERHHA